MRRVSSENFGSLGVALAVGTLWGLEEALLGWGGRVGGHPLLSGPLLVDAAERDGGLLEQAVRIRLPAGVPIGSRTPAEIALSIAAEIVAVRNGRAETDGI